MLLVPQRTVLYQVVLFASSLPCVIVARSVESRSTVPAPLSIPPSQTFDGCDGPWSTFTLRIGNPPQSVKVLISTYAHQTWAIAEEGCGSGDPTDCNQLRGGLYNYSSSTSYVPNLANLTTQIYDLGLESNLGYSGNGRYGFDDVTLGFQGSNGPSLRNQTVAGVATKAFFFGILGLKPTASNFTSFSDPIPSFMQNLKNQSMIPSTSWAYTAGNQYRSSPVLGSLTLGGYDASKFKPNNLTFSFSSNDQPDLAVQIASITTVNTTSNTPTTLLSMPITTYLDSTIPYIYFPQSVCDVIASTFGLTYNSTMQLYTISSTQHTLLQAQSPNITFTLTRPDLQGTPLTLNFPYASFSLKATWPLIPSPSSPSQLYFPIKVANDSSQYRLGRSFFQEAYIIADYERRNFSVSQVRYDVANQNIISILPPTNTTSSSSPPEKKGGLSTGAVAGIAVAGAILLLTLLLLLFYFRYYRPRHASPPTKPPQSQPPPTTTTDALYTKPELPANPPSSPPPFPGAQEIHSTITFPSPRPITQIQKEKEVVHELPAREEVAAEVPGSANLSHNLLAEQNEILARQAAQSETGETGGIRGVKGRRGEKIRWSWDRRRRASLGEASLGLGSQSQSETETVTRTDDLSSGWGDRDTVRTGTGTGEGTLGGFEEGEGSGTGTGTGVVSPMSPAFFERKEDEDAGEKGGGKL